LEILNIKMIYSFRVLLLLSLHNVDKEYFFFKDTQGEHVALDQHSKTICYS
jgi:hypothetical protein